MTQVARRQRRVQQRSIPTQQLGKKPTNSQKLLYISQSLGIDLSEMQGSTMNIVDTVPLTYSTNRQTFEFFINAQGKTRTFSNFQTGNLNAGEAMVMEEIKFFMLQLSQASLTDPTTSIISMAPIGNFNFSLMSSYDSFQAGLMSITIANKQVVKDYQINDSNPNVNKKTTGVSPSVGLTDAGTQTYLLNRPMGQSAIELEAPPVLPPNQKLKVTLEIPPVSAGNTNMALMCVIGRFGSIFSANIPL